MENREIKACLISIQKRNSGHVAFSPKSNLLKGREVNCDKYNSNFLEVQKHTSIVAWWLWPLGVHSGEKSG